MGLKSPENAMRVFAISGYSGAGKTTLVERIISTLVEEGYTVVSAKSTMHDIHEEEGTDSWKHRRSGATATLILGPKSSSVTYENRRTLHSLACNIDADYLIVEGMKESEIPKIWCLGEFADIPSAFPKSVKAIVSKSGKQSLKESGLPVYLPDEIEKIISIVKREAVDLSELQA
jgi:molybdopterin-guanine dinucleotide biosynthesis protein B